MTPDEYRAVRPRIGVNDDMRKQGRFPMLFERSVRVCLETNPAHGGYTTAHDLSRFYSALLARLDDGAALDGSRVDALPPADVLREFVSPARAVTYDRVLDRECSYGLGFMTDLRRHAFGDACSPTTFGHSGNIGSSFGFADPERGLAVGAVVNGLVDHETAFLRRRALLNALYADLDAAGDPPAERASEPDAARPRRSWFGRRRTITR
jgi:CubicO group peptidase (beta-lactamase class C family)